MSTEEPALPVAEPPDFRHVVTRYLPLGIREKQFSPSQGIAIFAMPFLRTGSLRLAHLAHVRHTLGAEPNEPY